MNLVRPSTGNRVPQAVAESQPLTVLRELDGGAGQRELRRILGDQCVEVLLRDTRQAVAIARAALSGGNTTEKCPRQQNPQSSNTHTCFL
jgi:hypothetical protein